MRYLVVPESHRGAFGSGQWKDLAGIRQVLNLLGDPWQELNFGEGGVDELVKEMGAGRHSVIWYYSFWPEAMEMLMRVRPETRLILRAVNAEALQHWLRAEKNPFQWTGLPRDFYGMVRLFLRDGRSVRSANSVAGISPRDNAVYWRRFPRGSRVQYVPYVSPWLGLFPGHSEREPIERKNSILCMPGASDRISEDHREGFRALHKNLDLDSSWSMAMTGGIPGFQPSRQKRLEGIEDLGTVDNPWEWMTNVRAVAVPGALGYGAKTTVTDALAAGCRVLVHERQWRRLPEDEQRLTCPIHPQKPESLRQVPDFLSSKPESTGVEFHRQRMEAGCKAWQNLFSE